MNVIEPLIFEFATAGRILFGAGRLREAGPAARSLGSRAFLVTGRNAERAAPLVEGLEKSGLQVTRFAVEGEPTIPAVVGIARQGSPARPSGCAPPTISR